MIMLVFLIEFKLYIIDEFFVGLDLFGIQLLFNWMDEMCSKGVSILMLMYIFVMVEKYCDMFIIIY